MEEIEVQEHEVMRLNDDLRQEWHVNGMACEIPSCETSLFTSHRAYIKHWKKIHVQSVTVYKCDICSSCFNRRCALNRHYRFVHKLSGSALAENVASS